MQEGTNQLAKYLLSFISIACPYVSTDQGLIWQSRRLLLFLVQGWLFSVSPHCQQHLKPVRSCCLPQGWERWLSSRKQEEVEIPCGSSTIAADPLEMGQMDLFVGFTFIWEPFWKVASSVWENRTLLWLPVWCLRFPLHQLHLQPLCCRHLLRLWLLILKLLNILITNKSSKMYEIDQI